MTASDAPHRLERLKNLAPGINDLAVISSRDGTLQPYQLFLPDPIPSRPQPLIIALHGMGATEKTWFEVTPLTELAQQQGWLAAAPFGRGNWFFRGIAGQDVLDMLEELIAFSLVDARRVFLIGHSMGGFGAWWLGLGAPDRFAGIFPWSGFHPSGQLAGALHLGPGIVHSQDDEIVAFSWSQAASQELEELGIAHDFVECDGWGHGSPMIGAFLREAIESMAGRQCPSAPREIELAARHPLRLRAWWLTDLGHSNGLTGDILNISVEVLAPWDNGLPSGHPTRTWPVVEVSQSGGNGFAIQVGTLLSSTKIPGFAVRHNGQILSDPGLSAPLLFVSCAGDGGGLTPAGEPSVAGCVVIEPPDPSAWYAWDEERGQLGWLKDNGDLQKLVCARMMGGQSDPPALLELSSLSTLTQKREMLKTWLFDAIAEILPSVSGLILPQDSFFLPNSTEGCPLTLVDILESYVRPEEFLGIYDFAKGDEVRSWLGQERPFRLEWIGADLSHPDPVRCIIPLALGAELPLTSVFDIPDMVPESQPEEVWQGPGSGWPLGCTSLLPTPGSLLLSQVWG